MTNIEKKVKAFAKKASTVEHSGEIAYIVTRSDIVELNKSIESKIRQNERTYCKYACSFSLYCRW